VTVDVVVIAMAALTALVLTEIITAVLPVIIVIAAVPPHEREGLARLLATCDSSRKLRLWPALRMAVMARREQARRAEQPYSPRAVAETPHGTEFPCHDRTHLRLTICSGPRTPQRAPRLRSTASTTVRATRRVSATDTFSNGLCASRTSPGPYCNAGTPAAE
jgi:hypothetical protein